MEQARAMGVGTMGVGARGGFTSQASQSPWNSDRTPGPWG